MADHNGEGGAFALLSLLRTGKCGRRLFQVAVLVALVGAGAFLADGTITPSITVVSAVQGFQVGIPSFPNAAVVGISIGILVGVFTSQWPGSSRLGILYGPVLIVFFVVQFMLGIRGITQHPAIFKALNPYYAPKGIGTIWPDGKIGFLKVADAMLATTGAEAMYADIGHFGKTPMRLGWFLVVLPSVLSTYLGQLAMVAADPSLLVTDEQTLYFKQAPRALLWPLIVLTMLASIIASQAVISGTYSIVSQAMSLELLPRLHIKRTDWRIFGQVFIPEICIVMCVITVAITAGCQNSNALAAAYGATVSTSFITTSVLFLLVLMVAWRKPVYWWLPYGGVFGLLDLFIWSSTLTKFPSGGYIPFIMALALILLMLLWSWGARHEANYFQTQTQRWKEEHSQHAVDGLILLPRRLYVFLTGFAAGVPYTYQAFVKKIGVVPKLGMFVTIRFVPVPFVDLQRRFSVREEAPGLYRIRIYIGYAQSIGSLPALIDEGAAQLPPSLLSDEMVFVMGRTAVLADPKRPVFRRLLVHCYAILKRFAVSPDADLGIPRDHIELGTPIEL
ncbi:putative potassium transport system protein kup 3 [Cyanidiococcus yangmingshanensis]|uniref:Putative potassium transport system protein kup 3 n=1 Tax=Cyanidiococcus yangmingshanensis TaxID=2690220 RepID=A0A7J7IFF7_9RHOD|nr:putative potassium transport system protein kup 3 [Cyanidiococcus yangmingshanensis]